MKCIHTYFHSLPVYQTARNFLCCLPKSTATTRCFQNGGNVIVFKGIFFLEREEKSDAVFPSNFELHIILDHGWNVWRCRQTSCFMYDFRHQCDPQILQQSLQLVMSFQHLFFMYFFILCVALLVLQRMIFYFSAVVVSPIFKTPAAPEV